MNSVKLIRHNVQPILQHMSPMAIIWICVIVLVAECGLFVATLEVAKYKHTKQSSDEDPITRHSANAVDGDYEQYLIDSPNYCTHTAAGDEPSWWAVDLGAIYDISNVVIFGRTDCCTERLSYFVIEVFRPCRNKTSWFDDSIITVCHYQQEKITYLDAACPEHTVGRYVRIRLKDRNALALCEVEVHATFVEDVYSATFPYISGFQGHSYDGQDEVLWRVIANSDIQCTYMCAYTHDCHAADFNKKTFICTLMKRVDGANVVVNSGNNIFLVN